MRVLLTGSDGYIGAVMMPVLEAAGHEVKGVDTLFFAGCDFGVDGGGAAALREDVRDLPAGRLSGFDAVVHLAALCNDPIGDLNPAWTEDINYRASVRLASLAKEAGVRRFIFASSCSIYGASGADAVTEDSPLQPLTAYAVSKVRTEEALGAMADASFSPVFLRNATAYGVSPRLRVDVVLNNLTAWAHCTGKIKIMSDGTPWRPLVHVEDICRTAAAVLEAPLEAVHNQAFNVGRDDENYQVKDLAEIVRRAVPGCEIEYAGGASPDQRTYRVCFAKLNKALPGFRLLWNAQRGAEQLREAFVANHFGVDDLTGRKYTRLAQLRYLLELNALDETLRWRNREAARC